MGKITELTDPKNEIATITLKELADYRGVQFRNGSTKKLYSDLKKEVLCLASLKVTMLWKNKNNKDYITFGKEIPDNLINIVDIETSKNGRVNTSFSFRCGQALTYFLASDTIRWVGKYSKKLLGLNPVNDAFTKKLGTYCILLGIISRKYGQKATATPKTILSFCGESPDNRNPGRTVDKFIDSFNKLNKLGIIKNIPELEPENRVKGYFNKWLDKAIEIRLSNSIFTVQNNNIPESTQVNKNNKLLERPEQISNKPKFISQLRNKYNISQEELAQTLHISRQSLSQYERGKRPLPEKIKCDILDIFNEINNYKQ